MIKLAIVLDDPGYGGAYKLARDVGENLDRTTFEVRYYFLCEQPENPPKGTFLGKPNIDIDYSLKSYLRLAYRPISHEKNFSPINKALGDLDPDVIHFHTHAILLTLLKSICEVCPRAQLIYTDHSQRLRPGELSLVKQYLMSRVYRRLFRPARVAYVSRYAYETALALGYGCRDKCWMITNTIDTQKFKPKKSSTDTIRVVYLSRIHPAKGHHMLLDAWRQLPKNNKVSLHLYGKEADNGSVRERIRQGNFPNPVVYEGITSSPERVLQNAQIGVFPSYREGLPLALLEMMACGLPVVASDIPEIKSIITSGKDGLLFKCGNENDLAGKLQKLVDDKLLRHRLKKEARKTVITYYSDPIAEKYSNLYRSVATH